jgi:hypothetical protein
MTGIGRAGFYRWRVPRQAAPVEMEIRDQDAEGHIGVASLWVYTQSRAEL